VRVVQARDGLDFLLEAALGGAGTDPLGPEDLQGDVPSERFLFGEEDQAHAVFADLAKQWELAESLERQPVRVARRIVAVDHPPQGFDATAKVAGRVSVTSTENFRVRCLAVERGRDVLVERLILRSVGGDVVGHRTRS